MNTKISHFSPLDFPEQLRTYIEGANLSNSSSHSGARVLYLDSGYYLKIDQKGRLEREARIASLFEQEGTGTPVIHYLSTDKDYLLTKEAIGHDTLAFLDQPDKICRTMAEALKKLHSFYPQNFPSENHLQAYKDRAFKNYEKVSSMPRSSYPNSGLAVAKRPSSLFENKGNF